MKDLTVALYQMDVQTGKKATNLEKVAKVVQKHQTGQIELLVLPELFTTGFAYDHFPNLAEVEDESPTLQQLELLARKNELGLAGTILTTDTKYEQYFNLGFIIAPEEGVIYKYHKIHLWGREKDFFTPGITIPKPVFFAGKANIALATCYDLRFPEVYRKFAFSGAEVLITPAAWPKQRVQHFHLLSRARALENTCYHIAVNRFGEEQTDFIVSYNGGSGIFSPFGEELVKTPSEESFKVYKLSAHQLSIARKTIPVLADAKMRF